MNSFAFLDKAMRQRGDAAALIHGDETINYREFHARALAVAGNLHRLGCRPGDRVAFCLANSPRLLEVIYGCFAGGLIVVPINARLHAREMAYIASHSGAKVLIHGGEYQAGIADAIDAFAGLEQRICLDPAPGAITYAELLDPQHALRAPVEVEATDSCWLFYTSGTTGRPKGAIWTHRMVRCVVMNYLADLHGIQPGEVVLHAAPMSHGSGIVALPAVARGATQVILEPASFAPESLFAAIERYKVGHVAFLAPTQIIKMLDEFEPGRFDLSSLKAVTYGGAPIHVVHLRRAIETFGPVFVQLFGQGEAPITITGMTAVRHQELLDAGDPRIGSAGQVRTDVEAHCVDDDDNPLPPGEAGEVVVRGDVVMPGYWNDPEASIEALRGGWLHTGDIGMFDEQGYLFLLDRAKDMIVSGGNNVYPREVEEIIIQHPAVSEVCVVGIPDPYWGEAVHAVVVKEPGTEVVDQEIIAHCANFLAGYKKPKAVDFVDALPVSGYGKILRREVRERYWQGQGTRIGGGAPVGARA